MTRESYLDMCEAMGSEPIDEEIPVGAEDLLYETVRALAIYSYLPDRFDGMSGFPFKELTSLPILLRAQEVESPEDILYVMSILKILDADNIEQFNSKNKAGK